MKSRVRAALLIIVPACFLAILAPRGSVWQLSAFVIVGVSLLLLGAAFVSGHLRD